MLRRRVQEKERSIIGSSMLPRCEQSIPLCCRAALRLKRMARKRRNWIVLGLELRGGARLESITRFCERGGRSREPRKLDGLCRFVCGQTAPYFPNALRRYKYFCGPGRTSSPPAFAAQLCNPCLRYELSPFSQEGQLCRCGWQASLNRAEDLVATFKACTRSNI
jgi:hypothetical protein